MSAPNRLLLLAGLGTLLGACAAKRPAPAVQRYALGMSRAEYRDYAGAKASPCDAEPPWLADELTNVNGLLARFLRETEHAGDAQSPQQAQHLALLKEATGTLEPVLAVHEHNLDGLRACGFRRTGAFPELSRRGHELVKEARARLAEAPALLAAVRLREAQRRWKEEAPAREATARGTWCTARPTVGSPDLYYARQSVDGGTVWLFCDGHVVRAPRGEEPTLQSPDGLSRRELRRVQPKRYLDAARDYPRAEIDRPPESLPAAGVAKERAQGVAADGPT